MRTIILLAAFSVVMSGQPTPRFEVASAKPAAPLVAETRVGPILSPGKARFVRMTLPGLIAYAYRVRNFQISAPVWSESSYFSIDALLPDGASSDQVPDMLRLLLEERFQLRIRRETRQFPVHEMGLNESGPKLIPFTPTGPKQGEGKLAMTLDTLASFASDATDRPLVNATGMSGEYLIQMNPLVRESNRYRAAMHMAERNGGVASDPGSGTLESIMADLGLKLTPKKVPMQFLVVESAEKTPSEN